MITLKRRKYRIFSWLWRHNNRKLRKYFSFCHLQENYCIISCLHLHLWSPYNILKIRLKWAKIANFPRLWRHSMWKLRFSKKITSFAKLGSLVAILKGKFVFFRISGFDVIMTPDNPRMGVAPMITCTIWILTSQASIKIGYNNFHRGGEQGLSCQ